jgi:hypothetical protein
MEPTVTAALIGAGAKLFKTFIQVWSTSRGIDNTQRRVKNWISANYDSLHDCLSTDSVKLLAEIDGGRRQGLEDFINVLYPKHRLRKRALGLLRREFRYRLEFLVLLGVLRHLPAISRYELTRLGVAFLAQARAKRHYRKILLR